MPSRAAPGFAATVPRGASNLLFFALSYRGATFDEGGPGSRLSYDVAHRYLFPAAVLRRLASCATVRLFHWLEQSGQSTILAPRKCHLRGVYALSCSSCTEFYDGELVLRIMAVAGLSRRSVRVLAGTSVPRRCSRPDFIIFLQAAP